MIKRLLPFFFLFVCLNAFAQIRDTSCVPYYDTVTVNICAGDDYMLPDSIVVDSNGFYASTFQTFDMCDSIIYTDLTVTTIDTSFTINIPTCPCPTYLHANASGATYQWLNCNAGYAPIPGATLQDYTVLANGNYAVMITQNGCVDTSDCYYVLHTGIEALSAVHELNIFPTPVTNELTVSFALDSKMELSFSIYNMLGQELILKPMNMYVSGNNLIRLNLSQLPSGFYYLKAKDNKEERTLKFIKAN